MTVIEIPRRAFIGACLALAVLAGTVAYVATPEPTTSSTGTPTP